MSSKLKISKLKSYHIILLGCLLGAFLVLNSNSVNEEKLKIQKNIEDQAFFNRIISKRKLAENGYSSETEEVCSLASEELQEYYNTSDLSKIDLDNGAIKCEDKDKDYMKALINIVKSLIEGDDEDDNEGGNPINDVSGYPEGGLRNLLDSETTENIKTYGSRIFPLLVFAVLSLLCIIGWVICCFCTCCKCCCCCCCKKPECKIPCFIFTYIFYACAMAVCLYGVTQTNKIFTGLSNTECSFLKFFEQILKGETKEERPKWIGIEGVSNILTNLHNEITEMSDAHLEQELDIYMEEITEQRDNFLPRLKTVHNQFYEDEEAKFPKEGYYIEYQSSDNKYIENNGQKIKLEGKYVLDLVPLFGKYDEEHNNFTGLNALWNLEISEIDQRAGGAMEEARDSFVSMLGDNLGKIEEGLSTGSEKLNKLRRPFDNVYNKISGALYDASKYSNDYGDLGVKIVFGTVAGMNAILAALLILICCCSGKSCADCCCCRCLCKLATHLIWNILALFMIVAFLVGSLLSIVGRVGGDVMSLVSFIMSEENFNDNNPILLNKLGSGKDVLRECVVEEGNLSKVFKLDEITKDFDVINEVREEIQDYKATFVDLAQSYPAYYFLKAFLTNRTDFTLDTNFINENADTAHGVSPAFTLSQIMKLLNDSIGTNNNEKWNPYTGDKSYVCTATNPGSISSSPNGNLLHPWTCQPIYRGWVSSSTDEKIKNYAKITSDAIDILKYASNDKMPDNPDYESYYDILDNLKIEYTDYLNTFVNVLGFFERITGNIVNALEDGIGNSNDTFSFLNGKFIKTNLKIVLKYLKYSLGKDIYTVGLCLVIVGFSLIFSISMTILLLIIIDVDLEKNKKLAKNDEVPDYPVNNEGRVVQFKNY